jgi:ribonuclease HI
MITALYTDGGVIGSNPSAIGGTYAYRVVDEDGSCEGEAFVVASDRNRGLGLVTNNQTEMLAMLKGLKQLRSDFAGTIYSDSAVTLGRVFNGWKWNKIPMWMQAMYREERSRFQHWDQIQHVLLDGHPTRAQLAAGTGKRGHPVSEHNVWCDQACTEAGQRYMDEIGKNIPTTQDLQAVLG